MFGDISFKRRYYKDTETKRYVYLLDEVLGIDGGISPCLAAVAAVETDRCFLHTQKQGRGNQELKTILAHEGWENRTSGSKEYELLNKTYDVSFELEEFWDEANRHLYCKYDIDDDTIVVIRQR